MFHKVEKRNGNKKIHIEENALVMLQLKLPLKCKDPKVFEFNGKNKLGVAMTKHIEPRNKVTRLLKYYWHEEEVMKKTK